MRGSKGSNKPTQHPNLAHGQTTGSTLQSWLDNGFGTGSCLRRCFQDEFGKVEGFFSKLWNCCYLMTQKDPKFFAFAAKYVPLTSRKMSLHRFRAFNEEPSKVLVHQVWPPGHIHMKRHSRAIFVLFSMLFCRKSWLGWIFCVISWCAHETHHSVGFAEEL